MRSLPQWVVWKRELRDGKLTKVPYNARTDRFARTNDPLTWSPFEDALDALGRNVAYLGIGFVFAPGGGIFGFDADHLRDKDSGEIAPEARAWLDQFATYTEISPSGEGVHAYGFGELPGEGKKRSPFEIYDQGRFFTVTGQRLDEYPAAMAHVNGPLNALWELLAKGGGEIPDAAPPPGIGDSILGDAEVIDKASNASNGAAFRALWAGDTSDFGGDDSGADMSLCNRLAFYCGCDAAQMDRIFRDSGLMRGKWDERRGRTTYGQKTIAEAIRITTSVYDGTGGAALVVVSNGHRVDRETGEMLEDAEDAGEDTYRPTCRINDSWAMITGICAILRDRLARESQPFIYSNRGDLATVHGVAGSRVIRPITGTDFGSIVAKRIRIVHLTKDGDRVTKLSRHDAETIISACGQQPDLLPAPGLAGIMHTPFIAADGRIVTHQGYDPPSRCYLDVPSDLADMAIPDKPSTREVTAAKDCLERTIIAEFEWADDASRASAWAALFTPALLTILPESANIPGLLINKPAPGSGATYFAQIVGTVYAGEMPEIETAPAMDDINEWRKTIITILRNGQALAIFDNITEPLGNAVLMALLTTRRFGGRLLGTNDSVTQPNNALYVFTGNNTRPVDDMIRRLFLARIDTGLEHPDQREFKRDPLGEAHANRRKLVTALLTIVRAYIVAGRKPVALVPFVSYDAWAQIVGGILATIGVDGFLTNREAMRTIADEEGSAWATFMAALHAWQPNGGDFKTGQLLIPVNGIDTRLRGYTWATPQLEDAAPEHLKVMAGEKRLLLHLGKSLCEQIDRPHGTFVLKRDSTRGGSPTYRVDPITVPSAVVGEGGDGQPLSGEGLNISIPSGAGEGGDGGDGPYPRVYTHAPSRAGDLDSEPF